MKHHIETITNLLLGAAYADKRLEGREIEGIETLLKKMLGKDELPAAQAEQLRSFNPARFDVHAAASKLRLMSGDEKRKVLDLVVTVNEADDELAFAEDRYLKQVAAGMGLGDDDVKDLTIEIIEDAELEGLLEDED